MLRSIPFIIAALAEVGITGGTARAYAPILQEEGKKRNFDPVTVITLIKGESSNNPRKVNSLGCVGLGQICVKANYAYCKPGKTYNKARCDAKVAQLKSGPYNLRVIARAITSNRKYCNKKTSKRGKARNQWRHWLPSYGGYNNYKNSNIWCGQKRVKTKRGYKWVDAKTPERIRKYMARRKRIIRAVLRKMRRKRRR